MEFSRLLANSISCFFLLILVGCHSTKKTDEDFYQFKRIYVNAKKSQEKGHTLLLKSIKLEAHKKVYLNKMMRYGQIIFQDSFLIREEKETLLYKKIGCEEENKILLIENSFNFLGCGATYPFFYNEEVKVCGIKTVKIGKQSFFITKISSEDESGGSVSSYWLNDFGFIMLRLEQGTVYELKQSSNHSVPFKSILKEMKKDVSFSELFKIPPPPPLPPYPILEEIE